MELNNIPKTGNWNDVSSRINDNFSKVNNSITRLDNIEQNRKGYFVDDAELKATYPSPNVGWYAYVGSTNSIWDVNRGNWRDTQEPIPSDVDLSGYAHITDLALKANHGYTSNPKTLKQVDDEIVQLAGDTGQLFAQSDLESGYFAPVIDTRLAMSPLPTSDKWYMIIDVREGETFTLYGRSVEDAPRTYAVLDNKRFVIKLAPRYTAWDNNTPIEIVIPDGGVKLLIQVMNPSIFRLISNKVGKYLNNRLIDATILPAGDPIQNKILNIHKYGIPANVIGTDSALYYNGQYFSQPSYMVISNIPKTFYGNAGNYLGFVVAKNTVLSYFRTKDAEGSVVGYHERIYGSEKDIIYVDISSESVVNSEMYITTNVVIYDMFLTDEIPTFNLLPYEVSEEVPWEQVLKVDGKSFTQTITPNMLIKTNDNTLFKRYMFLRVKSSLPDLIPDYFQVRITTGGGTAAPNQIHRLRPGETQIIDLGENHAALRWIFFMQEVAGVAGSWIELVDIRTSDSMSINADRKADHGYLSNPRTLKEVEDEMIIGFDKSIPVQNKILDIHKYGVPSEITSPAEANLWKIDDFFYHPNLFRCKNIRTPINGKSGKYFGFVIDTATNVNTFNTLDVNNAVVFQHESLINANKKIIYVDLSIGDVDKTFLYLSGQVKIYDIFLTDEVPTFNLIPYEINDAVKWEDLFWKDRDTFTPVITPAHTYTVIVHPADIRLNSFKRYVFFRVRSSLPDTCPQTFFFDTLNSNASRIKRSHVRWSREWAYVDLGENLDSIMYLNLVSYPGTGAQGGSWLQLYDMRTSDSLSLNAVRDLDYPSFETAYEGKDRKLDYFRVGSKIFTGSAPSVIRKDNDFTAGGWSDLSMYDYTGKKISFKEARKQKVVDLASRYLSCITPEGEMYFRNGTAIEKIDVETFLNSIQSHDGTGLDYSRLSYINLPTDATALEKQATFDSMKAEWYQFTGATEQVNPSGGKEIGQMFGNGSILFGTTLVREDGTIATPVLKNPVAGNPTHLIIKDESDAVLHEIPLYGNIAETYRWGSFIPDEGSINYTEIVESIINFTNEKTLTVALPTSLVASTYKIVLRGRRFGTTLVNGDVEISSNDITLGTISLSGTGTKRALIDNEISVTTSSAINEIKMTLSCATEKPLTVGNGMSSDGSWGRTADGRFGTIVEYVSPPERDGGKCYLTQDNGETWEDVFDAGLNELFGSGQKRVHLHGARYDRYWNKLYIVGGDYNENRPFHHADISTGTTIDNISWVHEPINGDEYITSVTEQYCTVYPDVDHIHFGTDYTISGMWRMNRINKNVMTGREPSFIVASYRLTHIPTSYFKADDGELFVLSMLGDPGSVNEALESTYRSMRLDSTLDGVTWKEVWRNDVGGGFGENAYMNVHYFDNKLFLHIYGDRKFSTNHSLVILEYK